MKQSEHLSILNNQLKNKFTGNPINYSSIQVLLLYWQDADQSVFQEEAERLKKFFTGVLNYPTSIYAIPSNKSHLELQSKISHIGRQHNGESLTIIHYGGHGDDDDKDGALQRSVWAAKADGGPTLNWFEIQPTLAHYQGHVLLILDCCFAGQATRASVKRTVPDNVYLIAACGMGRKTPAHGNFSFTNALLKAMKACIDEEKLCMMPQLMRRLTEYQSGLKETTFSLQLGDDRQRVRLVPLLNDEAALNRMRSEQVRLIFEMSMADPLEEGNLREIVTWLSNDPPQAISKVIVQQICHVAEYLQESRSRSSQSATSFSNLPQDSQKQITNGCTRLIKKVSSYILSYMICHIEAQVDFNLMWPRNPHPFI